MSLVSQPEKKRERERKYELGGLTGAAGYELKTDISRLLGSS